MRGQFSQGDHQSPIVILLNGPGSSGKATLYREKFSVSSMAAGEST